MIPLGLYRTETVSYNCFKDEDDNKKRKKYPTLNNSLKSNESAEKTIRYVVTNPCKDLRLRESDLVFVLAQDEPPEKWDLLNNEKFIVDSKKA